MNGVGLPTVGRLLGHRRRATTAIYAHLDDTALQDAAAQAGGVIAGAMGYRAAPPPLPDEAESAPDLDTLDRPHRGEARSVPPGSQEPVRHSVLGWTRAQPTASSSGPVHPRGCIQI